MAIIPQVEFDYDEDARGFVRWVRHYVVDEFSEIKSAGNGDFDNEVRIVSRKAKAYKGSPRKKLVVVVAEGINPEGWDANFDPENGPPEDKVIFEFDVVLEDNPIETHPKILELIDKYGGRRLSDGSARVTFDAPFLKSGQTSGSGGFSGNNAATGERNPMYGLTSYLTIGAMFRMSFVVKEVPHNIFDVIGRIEKTLPYGIPTPEGHSWVMLAPRCVRRGFAVTVDVQKRLIRDDGGMKIALELMYGAQQK